MRAWSNALLFALALSGVPSEAAEPTAGDPLDSVMWEYNRQIFLADQPYRFDERVLVELPPFAEDPTQVPLTVDASALAGRIERVIAWADLNPIQQIFNWYPAAGSRARLSLRFKVQQATPVRAAVLTQDGVWHVGSGFVDAAGGGCTAPSMANSDPYWESHLGEIAGRRFQAGSASRYRFKVIHPMDTGLVNNIPEFFLQQLELRDGQGSVLSRMELFPPVSENPVFTFDLEGTEGPHRLWLRDNGGNEFERTL
ncbi:quinoprotein dehydrogenase-associated SoxYZ-like carrier [Marinobacterium arenosum]|uniref:quinoprotein dehydrogenase-associated SoxYZ-like carrier n=1 Tax=Marinobacterium arenosum TaxID=2862496 RepID=UPI001C98A4E6|nr:quinoprotein dehydrogenase-associated SoxYZ-like carrier [Marinobacterium arenosum]MBY4675854.1 quinoprotein dehydrogenase-associated SoxYZ-like carrier [Marinobacterium arenosum]